MSTANIIDLSSPPLTSKEVMGILGYKSRAGFFAAVWRDGIPCVRVTQRKIIFPVLALADWMTKRSNSGRIA